MKDHDFAHRRKILLVLALAVLTVEGAFAQTDFEEMAKNTVVVDIGPTIMGAAISVIGSKAVGDTRIGFSYGFGIAAQYERQIFDKFSVAGRFAYLGVGVGAENNYVDENGVTVKSGADIDMSSFSIEGHARFYPWGETFFLDGMLGFANMSMSFSGSMKGTLEVDGKKHEEKVSADVDASQGFIKLGAKVGWRINFSKNRGFTFGPLRRSLTKRLKSPSFGENGGFTFEPSLGYSVGIGFGDTIGQQLSSQIKKKTGADIDEKSFDDVFNKVENFIFIGGPRVTLAFGYRF